MISEGGGGGDAARARRTLPSPCRSPAASPPGRARARRSTRSRVWVSAGRWTKPGSRRSNAPIAERGSPVQVELSTAGDPSIGALLTRRGYVLVGFENVLALSLEPGPRGGASPKRSRCATVRRASSISGSISSSPASPRPTRRASPRTRSSRATFWTAPCAISPRRAASCARSRCTPASRPAAEACGCTPASRSCAARRPCRRMRRRGVQSSLLEARLALAAASGSEVAVVTTQPGSKSQQNVQRQGFELVYARAPCSVR